MSDYQSIAPTTSPLSLADAKRQLNLSSTADDMFVQSCVDAAALYLEQKTNRCFINQTRVCKMRGFADSRYVHDREIYPPRSPLSSVSSIKYIDTDNTTQTLASSDYRVSTGDNPGRIAEEYNATWPGNLRDMQDNVTVTYVAGHGSTQSNVPENVKHAMRLVVGHWYRNRESVGQVGKEIDMGVDALLESEWMPTYG